MTTHEPLGPALVSWNDYVGTAAADECDVGDAPSLYEITDLDPKAWTIVGIDLAVGQEPATLTVYAFDRIKHGVRSFAELLDHAIYAGELPVTAFELAVQNNVDVLALFKQVAVRLIVRGVQHDHLVVTEFRRPLTRPTTPTDPAAGGDLPVTGRSR